MMNWSSAPPTAPGCYWFRTPGGPPKVFLVRLRPDTGAVEAAPFDSAGEGRFCPSPAGEWAGPIAVPGGAATLLGRAAG